MVLGERWHHSGGIHQEKGGHRVPHNMRSRMGDSHLGRTVLSSSYGRVHFPLKLIVLAGHPLVHVFSTRANAKLPLCVSPVLDFVAWEDSFRHSLGRS